MHICSYVIINLQYTAIYVCGFKSVRLLTSNYTYTYAMHYCSSENFPEASFPTKEVEWVGHWIEFHNTFRFHWIP